MTIRADGRRYEIGFGTNRTTVLPRSPSSDS
jgi:hypothetical protein